MIVKVEMPLYLRRVKLSEKRQPYYYNYNGISIQSKKGKKVPKIFLKSDFKNAETIKPCMLLNAFTIVLVKGKKITLINEDDYSTLLKDGCNLRLYNLVTKKLVLANPGTADTPNFITVNGQHIYSGKGGEFTRGTIMDAIKEFYAQHLVAFKPIEPHCYPLRVKLYIFDTVNGDTVDREVEGQRWDVGNRAYPYGKAFLDILANGYNKHNYKIPKLIIDDDRLHVTEDPQGGIFCPVNNVQDRKLVFLIGTDNEEFHKEHLYKDLERTRLTLLKNNKHYDRRTYKTINKAFPDTVFEGF